MKKYIGSILAVIMIIILLLINTDTTKNTDSNFVTTVIETKGKILSVDS